MKEKVPSFKINRPELIFASFVLLFCGLFVFVEFNNGKFWTNDFKVYYEATRAFFNGLNPYGQSYGLETGYFKYPPFVLFIFAPITAHSYVVAQFIHVALMGLSLMVSIPILKKTITGLFPQRSNKKRTWNFYAVFFMGAIAIAREFHMGNINVWLLLFFSLGFQAFTNDHTLKSCFWWSLMIIFKPFMIAVIIPLLILKKWRLILGLASFGLIYFLFPILKLGWTGNLGIWNNWYQAISAHGDYIISYNAIGYLLNTHFNLPVSWVGPILVLLILIGLMIFDGHKHGQSLQRNAIWVVVFIAFVPNFFITDTEHFLISIPLFVFLFTLLPSAKNWKYWLVFSLAMLLFSFNSNDLLGRTISDFLYDKGAVGVGNLIFISLLITVLFYNNLREEEVISQKQ